MDEELRNLCFRLAAADDSELPIVDAELRAALKRNGEQIRLMASEAIHGFPPSDAKAAD